jgi:hypothetical protein
VSLFLYLVSLQWSALGSSNDNVPLADNSCLDDASQSTDCWSAFTYFALESTALLSNIVGYLYLVLKKLPIVNTRVMVMPLLVRFCWLIPSMFRREMYCRCESRIRIWRNRLMRKRSSALSAAWRVLKIVKLLDFFHLFHCFGQLFTLSRTDDSHYE